MFRFGINIKKDYFGIIAILQGAHAETQLILYCEFGVWNVILNDRMSLGLEENKNFTLC